jgi:hypothetical protein
MFHAYLRRAVASAARGHGLGPLIPQLERIVPDISHQYTNVVLSQPHLAALCRANHAFQTRLLLRAVDGIPNPAPLVVDIGDSSGTHMQYLKALRPDRAIETLSVNLDPKAVEKIKARGFPARLCAAEDLDPGDRPVDLFISFETLEHLLSPPLFLHRLATRGRSDRLLITVPYVPQSRVGLYTLRRKIRNTAEPVHAENEHFFELSPQDWMSLFMFCGWRPVHHEVFRIANPAGPYHAAWQYWRRVSFTGFLGLYAERDLSVANRFVDWPA